MKKVFGCVLLALVLSVLIMPLAIAEGAEGLPTEPFTWEYLATLAGATVGTLILVQLLKLPLDKVWKIPTRIIVFLIACVIMLLAKQFTDGLDTQSAILTVLNALIVALAAMGAYEMTFRKIEDK